MPVNVIMPQMGESVAEGTITRWLVHEGDRVEKEQLIVEISTDKIDTEIPYPTSGMVKKILYPEGKTLPGAGGGECGILDDGGGDVEDLTLTTCNNNDGGLLTSRALFTVPEDNGGDIFIIIEGHQGEVGDLKVKITSP